MANNNQIELVVTVEVDKANKSIKTVNANLSSIEAAATKSARAASQGIDGMTASMVKGATAGNLLADAIKGAIDFAKQWTVEAAKQAAHLDRAVSVTHTLATAHGDGAAAAQKAMEAIRDVGFTAQDAATSVQKLIIADIGLEKAQGLARVAKDAAAVSTEGLTAAEAFEKIMLAVETGQSRGLRTMSIFVDLNKAVQIEELKRGRSLTDLETKQVRYNAVMEAATRIQGAGATAAETFDGQMAKLGRDVTDLKNDIGKSFQDELQSVVSHLRGMVAWLKENIGLLEKFGQVAIWLAGILATYEIATKISAIAGAVRGLTAALAANPWALLVTGVVAAGAITYKTYTDMQESMERKGQSMENAALRQQLSTGKVSIADLRSRGMTDDQIREITSGRGPLYDADTFGKFGEFGPGSAKYNFPGKQEPDLDSLKLAADIHKREIENEKYFREQALGASGAGKTGYAKDVAELNAEIGRRTSFVDEKGATHQVSLTKAAWDSIIDAARKKLDAFKEHFALENRKALEEQVKSTEEAHLKELEFEAHRFHERIQNDVEIADRNIDHLRQVYGFEDERAGIVRDARLRQLEVTDAQTIPQKIAVEQQKAAIEIDYLEKVHEVKQRLYDIDTSRMLLEEELNLKRLGYQADEIKARIDELAGQRAEIRKQSDEANDAAVQAARENAANRAAQLVRDHNRQVFESLKQQAGGVFDALLQKSESVWKAIGNSLKTALLTAIKDVVTSRVAAMLMMLFTGQRVSFAGGGATSGGGMLGDLGGLLGVGAVPVFGGSGGGMFGSGPVNGTPMILSALGGGGAAAGGRGGFGGAASGLGSGMFNKAGAAGMLGGLQSFLGFGGGVQYAPGMATTWAASTFGQKLSALGRSNAALAAGGMLAFDGLRRGGWLGVGETTAGGALIGYKFGGPLGAAIGAGVGFAAGIVRLFIKGAIEKARAKIKAIYGVDISDKKILQQIVDTAKQGFGGNLDVAIRSPQIQDLIKLYAMTTGQKPTGLPATMRPLDLVQTGGLLYQAAGFENGSALAGLGGLPTLDRVGAGVASGAGAVVIKLDGPATTSLLRGEAVQAIVSNPRAVAGASVNAAKANAGRRQLTSLQMSPGLLTA